VLVVLAVLTAACGGSEGSTSTSYARTSTTDGTTASITSAPPSSTTAAPATTAAPETTIVGHALMAADEGLGAGGTDNPNDEPYDLTFFENYGVNPRIDTEDDALSTFAVDVDTGSYTIGRRWIQDGNLPDKDSVRVEEYVNYFEPGYPAPVEGTFALYADGGPTPYAENERYQMLRIGIQGMVVSDDDRPQANLVFVIDISGSMDREDRLETVKDALGLLVAELRPDDRVGIVVYGNSGRVHLEPTEVENAPRILQAIERLGPGGSTNAEEGLFLGYQMAAEMYRAGSINRVILASDGVANVGNTGADSILRTIEEQAAVGIQLVTVGFGMGNYNDVLMEQLADDGDGFYAYVDDLEEAERLFVLGLTGTLFTIARETKVQVEFDPATVERWRLIGFENRALQDEDFRDDTVDAGEVGAGHHVTALYEIRLADEVPAEARLGTVRLRWLDPETEEATEMERDFSAGDLAASWQETSRHFQLAATVATFAEVLRESYWAQHSTLDDLVPRARRLEELMPGDTDVAEFADLVDRAAGL
jgi:Ca-activated chloride channel family protein